MDILQYYELKQKYEEKLKNGIKMELSVVETIHK